MHSRLFLRHVPEGVVHIAEIARCSCNPEDPERTGERKLRIDHKDDEGNKAEYDARQHRLENGSALPMR